MGFDAAFGGVDYSQQTLPQVSVTDGVTNGTTTVTSASAAFTASLLGNGLNIAGDGLYQITAVVSATQVTVDRITANGGVGRTMKVGGAGTIQNAGNAFDPIVLGALGPGLKQWVRGTNAAGVATVYSQTPGSQPALNVSGTATNPVTTEGYSTVRGDGGRAVIAFPGWAFLISGSNNIVRNLEIRTGGAGGVVASVRLQGAGCHLENIICDPGGAGGTNGPAFLQDGGGADKCVIRRLYTKAGSSSGGGSPSFDLTGNFCIYEYCDIASAVGTTGGGVRLNSPAVFRNCIIRDNAQDGVIQNGNGGPAQFSGCLFWNNGRDGVRIVSSSDGLPSWLFESCVFGMNAGYDFNYVPGDISGNGGAIEWAKSQLRCNWFLTTGTGRYNNLPVGADDSSLTVNPFVASAAGNFTLNSLSGGGAAITAAPCAISFADGLNSASVLAGPYGVIPSTGSTTGMRSLWREFTNERSTVVIPDSTVDAYLNGGLQALNRRVRYHLTDTTAAITLAAGQQEYALPSDTVFVAWVQWNGKELQKADTDEWRRRDIDWRNAKAGAPAEWAHYRDKLIFYPPPDAQAVAAQPAPLIRYVSSPPDISASGPEQVTAQDQRLAVYWGVQEFAGAHPDSALATLRAEHFQKLFDQEVEVVAKDYADRLIGR